MSRMTARLAQGIFPAEIEPTCNFSVFNVSAFMPDVEKAKHDLIRRVMTSLFALIVTYKSDKAGVRMTSDEVKVYVAKYLDGEQSLTNQFKVPATRKPVTLYAIIYVGETPESFEGKDLEHFLISGKDEDDVIQEYMETLLLCVASYVTHGQDEQAAFEEFEALKAYYAPKKPTGN